MIEQDLIEECRRGDFNNFRKLAAATTPFAFSVAFRMLGEEEAARDIVQDTLVTIWQKLSKIKTAEVYKTWVYRIVVNKCYDELRSRKRHPETVVDDQTWAALSNRISTSPSKELENRETAQLIEYLTSKLGPKQKAVFILSDLEEMSNDEISEITGLSKSVVKSNLHYARKCIGENLNKIMGNERD